MTEPSSQRDSFQSRLGFILVSAGCAIGIGNVWKFPYLIHLTILNTTLRQS